MTETLAPEIMSEAEINERYKNEFVLVADPVYDEDLTVISGKVIGHSPDRDEVYRIALELLPESAAFLYTGPPVEDIFINL